LANFRAGLLMQEYCSKNVVLTVGRRMLATQALGSIGQEVPMSTDAKDVTRRFYEEIINQKNVDAIDRFCTADFVDHNPPPGGKGNLDATKQQFLELAAGFPDLKMIVQDQIAEGDRVVNRMLMRGTHKGEYMGIPGSGKTVEIGGIDILRMVNGKAAERWGYFDDVKLMQQLGAMPRPTK